MSDPRRVRLDALHRLAKKQDPVFSRAQAAALGLSDDVLLRRIRDGGWERVGSGLYLLPSHPWGWRQRSHAALLANPAAVLSGLSACRVYGLPDLPRVDHVTMVVPSAAHASSAWARVQRSSMIRPRLVDGFRVNALPFALREVAADVPDALPALFENPVVRRQVRLDQMADVAVAASIRRLRGRPPSVDASPRWATAARSPRVCSNATSAPCSTTRRSRRWSGRRWRLGPRGPQAMSSSTR